MPEVKELKKLDVAGSATGDKTKGEFFLQWHLTERCNMACSHCYQSGERCLEMDIAAIRETANEVSEMVGDWEQRYSLSFAPSFNITGGEPFLRQDLFEILELLRSLGWETYLLTNGTLIDSERARRLKDLVDGVQVSIEGSEGIHDSIRGRGAFQAAARGVNHLVEAGVRVSLNATISRLNVEHLTDLVTLGSNLGVERVGFSRLVPRGRGKQMRDAVLPANSVKAAYASLLRADHKGLKVSTGDPIASFIDDSTGEDSGDVPIGGCAAGVSGLTLLADGTLTPCRRLPIPIGNVRNDSIRQVWVESPVLNDLRDRKKYNRCGSCRHWAICRGCRAIAYAWQAANGREDYLADDPQCFVTSQ